MTGGLNPLDNTESTCSPESWLNLIDKSILPPGRGLDERHREDLPQVPASSKGEILDESIPQQNLQMWTDAPEMIVTI